MISWLLKMYHSWCEISGQYEPAMTSIDFSFIFKWKRTRRTTSFSYLKHSTIQFTPCDYLNDLGGVETFLSWLHRVLWSLQQFSQSPRGKKAEQGVRSLKIATRQRELERKRLAELLHRSSGPFFSALLSHSLLMFLSAVQSGGCRDILPLGQHYKELPKVALAGCPPAIGWCFYTFLTDLLPASLGAVRSEGAQRWAQLGTATNTSTQQHIHGKTHMYA